MPTLIQNLVAISIVLSTGAVIYFYTRKPTEIRNKTALEVFNKILEDLQKCTLQSQLWANQDQFEIFLETWGELLTKEEEAFFVKTYYKILKSIKNELDKKDGRR